MFSNRIVIWAFSPFVLLATLAGCGNTAGDIVNVKGKVTFEDGAPLPEKTMLVLSSTTGGIGDAYAIVGPEGVFELKRASGGRGACVGRYAVSIRAPEDSQPSFYAQFDPVYLDGSLLSVDVTEGMGALDLIIKKNT